MSKSVKGIVMRDYRDRLDGQENAVMLSLRGVKGIATTKLRSDLAKKGIRVVVVRNSLARKTFEGSALGDMFDGIKGQSALAFGGNSVVEVAREIVELMKTNQEIELKAAVLDGQVFRGAAGVEQLSKFPTREEAIAKAVALVIGPAQKLVAAVKGPGAKIGGIVATIKDKLEKGEAIAPVS
ncbi:MAG: 50S ribosomal protein L10 [Phycisphaeraceae bacterium]|nr:50S ribosomal protein L10 [Phycisphaeraceae bacterium]